MTDAQPTISTVRWIEDSLANRETDWCGIQFYELSDPPSASPGLPMVDAVCVKLDAIRTIINEHGYDLRAFVPFVTFLLPSTQELMSWDPALWERTNATNASINVTKDGAVLYWGVWESHHESIPVLGRSGYRIIFRRSKGIPDPEPWEKFKNEIFILPDAT